MNCPKGFPDCIKTCATPTCRGTCPHAAECCSICVFEPDSILTRVQQGDKQVYDDAMRVILKGSDNEFNNLLPNL